MKNLPNLFNYSALQKLKENMQEYLAAVNFRGILLPSSSLPCATLSPNLVDSKGSFPYPNIYKTELVSTPYSLLSLTFV